MVHGMSLLNATTIANTMANAIANANANASYTGICIQWKRCFSKKNALIRKRTESSKCERTNVLEATSKSMAKNMQSHAPDWRNRGAPSQRNFSLIDAHYRSTRIYLLRTKLAIPAKATCQQRLESGDIGKSEACIYDVVCTHLSPQASVCCD